MGKSVHVVIIETKLDKAKKLLCESNLSIADIAHSCGFSNENYFATVFKRQYKLSPTSFRKIQ
ncbi:MAG: helix-turn-helix transcriptional regulator [Thermoguttaceae bacterium]|nr:helix-turn-helix transcriptional regulator [Thermoguttaceae bacterium]